MWCSVWLVGAHDRGCSRFSDETEHVRADAALRTSLTTARVTRGRAYADTVFGVEAAS